MKSESSWRLNVIGLVITGVAFLILGQLFALLLDQDRGDVLDSQYESYRGSYQNQYPARGLIMDRNGHLLAGNQMVYEVGIELQKVRNPHTIALTLNVVLGLDYAQTISQIEHPNPANLVYLVVADGVSAQKVQELRDYRDKLGELYSGQKGHDVPSLSGVVYAPHLKRIYPEKELASNLIGFVGRKDDGSYSGYFGVESQYDNVLAGIPVKVWVPNDPRMVEEPPKVSDGTTLVLTIDLTIQSVVEKILDDSVDSSGSDSGTIVVMDPQTGEILAMATTPRLDLNKYWKYGEVFKKATPFDRAISQSYEPGSVFKVLTMAAALDKGAVKPDTTYLDKGVINVGGVTIYNWDRSGHGKQNMQGCLQYSLNVCLAWVATRLGANDFYSYMKAFGIGHVSGVDIAGEASGRLKLPGDDDWYESDLGTNAFGQGVSATPIQMASAISALANDGKVMVPHIVRSIITNGQQYNIEPRISAMPISAKTSKTITEILARSLEAEASDALVEDYRVAGKTGTAEIPTPLGYTSGETNASFVGWGPVDDPRFLVYIWLEKPSSSIWGSEVAAPIFPKIVDQLVVLMDIPPDRQRKALLRP